MGIAREKKKERDRTVPRKALKHSRACSQNKGMSEYQRKASQQQTGPSCTRGREAGGQQPEPERGNLGPIDSIFYQTASRLMARMWVTENLAVICSDYVFF